MFINQIGIVSESNKVSRRDLMRVTAAVQKQVMRDFEPIWGVNATIDSFEVLQDVPIGYWPVIVRDDIGVPGAAGIHLDDDGQPFALVEAGPGWSLTASHEVLEMLADPFGDRLIAGDSVKPDQGRVEYLVEVCDPSEAPEFAYTVNGVLVSDFYTQAYFDPVGALGVRYGFTGALTGPRQVLRGGYLSWHNPVDNHWWQLQFFDPEPVFVDLGVFDDLENSLRSWIDSKTDTRAILRGVTRADSQFARLAARAKNMDASCASKASRWRATIERIIAGKKVGASRAGRYNKQRRGRR